ncbi:sensor histidine kinase [Ramlibacter tataouinensis]|uniref:sensor histidine kinase n=1 Tax=Ramlibacter tataouinensis TaxID=94132 RepID=UPI0002D72353|nr:ATP-binding protein [Ramlibacter tataouinensis]
MERTWPRAAMHLSFAAAAGLLLVLWASLYDVAVKGQAASESVGHTQEVLNEIARARLHFALADSAQRSWELTGIRKHLQERDAEVARFLSVLEHLKARTAENPGQQARVDRLRGLAGDWARGGPVPAVEASMVGATVDEQVQHMTEALRGEELGLLAQRQGSALERQQQALRFLGVAILLSLLILVPAYAVAVYQAGVRRAAERRLSDLVDNLPIVVWQMKSWDEGRRRRCVYVGENTRRVRDFSAEAMRRDPRIVFRTMAAEDRRRVQEAALEAERTLQPFDQRYRVTGADGVQRWVHSSAILRREADGSILWTGYWADITPQKELEQALERANRELEAFSYSVSHDLRAPLSTIDGFSHELWARAHAQLDDRSRHFLTRIRAGVRQMSVLIDGLLALATVSRAEIWHELVDVSALARQIAAELQESTPGRRVELVVQPGLQAMGDPRLVRQLLANLIGNAWKFTARQEHARIEVGRQPLEAGSERAFYVSDNGVGFDMAHARHLFSPFQRLHPAADFQGSGIGLATVQRIALRHGGRVWAQARPGEGATFFFTLGPSAKRIN